MLRSLCLILFLCCVLVAGAFPGTGRAQTDALPHLEQIAVRGKTSVASCLDGDTMQLTNRSRVRLAGIDTPELKPRKGKPQFYAREAAGLDQNMSEDTSAAVRVGVEALKLLIAEDKKQ